MEAAQYIAYLLSEPRKVSCVKASEVLEVSHDEINRFLLSNDFTGKELFEAVKAGLHLQGGTLSADDSVLDKPFTDLQSTELVGFFWSGRHHRTVKGINLIALFYTDPSGLRFPVNFRVYRHREGKSKHDYFRQMVKECYEWGLRPAWVHGMRSAASIHAGGVLAVGGRHVDRDGAEVGEMAACRHRRLDAPALAVQLARRPMRHGVDIAGQHQQHRAGMRLDRSAQRIGHASVAPVHVRIGIIEVDDAHIGAGGA